MKLDKIKLHRLLKKATLNKKLSYSEIVNILEKALLVEESKDKEQV